MAKKQSVREYKGFTLSNNLNLLNKFRLIQCVKPCFTHPYNRDVNKIE